MAGWTVEDFLEAGLAKDANKYEAPVKELSVEVLVEDARAFKFRLQASAVIVSETCHLNSPVSGYIDCGPLLVVPND